MSDELVSISDSYSITREESRIWSFMQHFIYSNPELNEQFEAFMAEEILRGNDKEFLNS